MYGIFFALARIASAAWVGAAGLFVLVTIQQAQYLEKKPRGLSEHAKALLMDDLALLRFPVYYIVGAALLGTALVSLLLIGRHGYLKYRRWLVAVGCLASAVGLMGYDYGMVYRPLRGLMLGDQKSEGVAEFDPWSASNAEGAVGPAPQLSDLQIEYVRSPNFALLHKHSALVNEVEILLVLAAALTLSWPGTRPTQHTFMRREAAH